MAAKEYTVWFELFGKKMKTVVIARDEEDAKKTIQKKIIFHKFEGRPTNGVFSGVMDKFDEIMDLLKDKK